MDALQTNIYITDVCSKGCPNCYYTKTGTHMTEIMAVKTALWIAEVCRNEKVEAYRCHILGGEPLENPDVLFSLLNALEEFIPRTTKGAWEGKYVLFTNGDLLAYHELSLLKKYHVKIMLNPTTDSLQRVEEKMNIIKSYCGGVSLAVVADDTNLPRLPKLAKLAVRFGGHVRINRLYDGGKDPRYVEEFRKQMHKVFDILLAAEKPMWPNFIMESTYVTWPAPKNPNACGRWLLVFDPNGNIRSCNADMETVMGNIETHTMSNLHFTHRWSAKNLPECQGCEWITWCQGGCPFTRKLTYGTYTKKTPFCEAYKTLFPRLMELKAKWEKTNGLERS